MRKQPLELYRAKINVCYTVCFRNTNIDLAIASIKERNYLIVYTSLIDID